MSRMDHRPINFVNADYLSFSDLLGLRKNVRVIRTAHPGNFDPLTMFIAGYFDVLLREDITAGADIYRPEFRLSRNGEERIASARPSVGICALMTCHEKYGRYALAYHYSELRKRFHTITCGIDEITALPQLEQVLRMVIKDTPREFDKYYDENGLQYRLSGSSSAGNSYTSGDETVSVPTDRLLALYKDHIRKIKRAYLDSAEGPGYPSVDISNNLFHAILLLHNLNQSGSGDIYHLCGSRMYEYLYRDSRFSAENQQNISTLLAAIQKEIGVEAEWNFFLVPTSPFKNLIKNVSDDHQYRSMYRLVESLKVLIQKERAGTLLDGEMLLKKKIIDSILSDRALTQYDLRNDSVRETPFELEDRFVSVPIRDLRKPSKSCDSFVERIRKYTYDIRKL